MTHAIRAILVSLVAGLLVGLTSVTPAQALSACTGVDLLHRPAVDQSTARPFYTELANTSVLHSGYAGYSFADASFADSDLWIRVSGFSSAALTLASTQSADIPVRTRSMADSTKRVAYVYLKGVSASTTLQSFTVTVSKGKYGTPGYTPICDITDGFSRVEDVIDAAANKVTSVTVSTTTPAIGGSFYVTAKGTTGTIGSGITGDQLNGFGVISVAPSMNDAWPADAFTLVGISWDFGNTQVFVHDRLRYYPQTSKDTPYTARYYFVARGKTSSPTPVRPVQNIASGQQIKYTGAYDAAAQISIAPVTQQLSITKAVASVTDKGVANSRHSYDVEYVISAQNRSASLTVLDSIVDSITVGAQGQIDAPTVSGSVTGTWGTSSITGTVDSTITDPSRRLFFNGPLQIPGNTTVKLTYKITVSYPDPLPASAPVANSAEGRIGADSIAALSGTNIVSLDLAKNVQLTLDPNSSTSLATAEKTSAYGADCLTTGTTPITCSFIEGSVATILADPPAGKTLSGWTVTWADGSAPANATTCVNSPLVNPCVITLSESVTVSPVYTTGYTVTIEDVGATTIDDGSGSPFRCTTNGTTGKTSCTKTYPEGATIPLDFIAGATETITAVTSDSATALANTSCTTSCSLPTLSGNVTLTLGRLSTLTYTLSVAVTGSGQVGATPTPIDSCTDTSGTCTGEYSDGSSVTLSASPAPGYRVKSWSGGGCSGTSTTCVVTMDASKNVTVEFELIPNDPAPTPQEPVKEILSNDPSSPKVLPPTETTGTDPGSIPLGTLPPNGSIEVAKDKLPPAIKEAKIEDGIVKYVADPTFSGKTIVPLKIVVDGKTTIINVPVTINPVAPIKGEFTPTAATNTNLGWQKSPNATGYKVYVNGKLVCETTATACNVKQILGPKAKITVVALGNDGTVSKQTLPVYAPKKPIPVLIVNFDVSKYTITPTAKKKLDAFVKMMKEQGFTRVVIEGHTDNQGGSSGATALSRNRARVVSEYLDDYLTVKFSKAQFGEKRPTKSNATKAGQAANRRATGAVW